jgi:hypothetical protein
MARETRAIPSDFNRLNTATTTARELYDGMLEIYSDRVNPGSLWSAANTARSSHEAYSYAHERLLVEGGGPIVGECCEDFMTSTNTYDPNGRL